MYGSCGFVSSDDLISSKSIYSVLCYQTLIIPMFRLFCYGLTRCGIYDHSDCLIHSQVAFIAGCLYTAVGILKLGWLTNFLSHSVISGFMSGASVIIALSQVPPYTLPQLIQSEHPVSKLSFVTARESDTGSSESFIFP